MGHSAGAHLSAMLTLNENYLAPKSYQGIRGFIGLAGAYDFKFDEPYQFEVFKSFKQHADSQPIHFVDGDEPPLLLLHGRNDTTVKLHNIINLTAKVKAKKGRVNSIYYDNINHIEIISTLSIPLQNQTTIHQDIIKFLALHRKKYSL
jgi:dipeptidyl aminopeptidase/acylaminoacyl peptidase